MGRRGLEHFLIKLGRLESSDTIRVLPVVYPEQEP
jgi:hypothetical protein